MNDKTITYDQIGNPLNDGTWTYTWQNGRQLQKMQKSGETVEFVYNENGLRVQKTATTTGVTKYTLHGKNVVHMTQGGNELHFFYDAQNKPAVVIFNGTPFIYVKNLQGDIVAILDSSKNVVVSYVYDAWGCPISCSGTMANTLGKVNPFRYRSYVYDEESGLYHLQSRYYCSTLCRFINPDSLISTNHRLLGHNVYIYCDNDPIILVDSNGKTPETVFDIISLGASIADVAINPWDPWAWIGLLGDVADVALPFVGGLGEAVDVLRAMNVIDDSVDVVKITENTLQVISDAATLASTCEGVASTGANYVYKAYQPDDPGLLEYVGITNDFDRREAQWRGTRPILPYIENVDRDTAHCAEQTIISVFGRNGNDLTNRRNSIGVNCRVGTRKDKYVDFFMKLMKGR